MITRWIAAVLGEGVGRGFHELVLALPVEQGCMAFRMGIQNGGPSSNLRLHTSHLHGKDPHRCCCAAAAAWQRLGM